MGAAPNPIGETKRVLCEEATAVIVGVPLFDFASFSIEIEDPSDRERTVDINTVHFDELINPSGSCSVFPTSPAAGRMKQTIINRMISTVQYTLPSADTVGSDTIIGVRFENWQQEDLPADGAYHYTADWQGDYITG